MKASIRTFGPALAMVALAALATVSCTRPPTGGPGPTTTRPSTPGTGYGARGPHATTRTAIGEHTYFHPTTMGQGGVRHPVVIWGNGTGADPATYNTLLTHWASHGFIVAAANTPNAGSGREMLAGLDYLTTANGQAGNRFNGVVDLAKVASSGHSQGGGGAIAAARDPRVKTMMPLQGAGGGAITNTALTAIFFSGQNDTLVNPSGVRSAWSRASNIPAAYAEARGATHFTINDSAYRPATTAWLKWQLDGDQTARSEFVGANCGLCTSRDWSAYEVNARLQAL
jgi:hypothetical protein